MHLHLNEMIRRAENRHCPRCQSTNLHPDRVPGDGKATGDLWCGFCSFRTWYTAFPKATQPYHEIENAID